MKKRMNKKADNLMGTIFFMILNVAVFAMLFLFVSKPNLSAYEQAYAKEIALLIDNAKPEMKLTIAMDKICTLTEACKDKSKSLLDMIRISSNKVVVSLQSGKSGYSYQFFSDYNIVLEVKPNQPRFLTINIMDKT